MMCLCVASTDGSQAISELYENISATFIKETDEFVRDYRHIRTVQPTRCDVSQFIYFCKTLYVFHTGFPSIHQELKTAHTAPGICQTNNARGQLKCDGTRAETRFRLSAKRRSPFNSAGASVQSTTGSRGVEVV